MKSSEISEVTAKAKVIRVCGGGYSLTLLCSIKELSYINEYNFHIGSVVFDDYSHKMALNILSKPNPFVSQDRHAYSKAERLVEGDIIQFTLRRDAIVAFDIIESKQKCLEGFSGLEHLINKFGKDNVPQATHYLGGFKVEKKNKEQIVEVQPVDDLGYMIVTDKDTKFTIKKKHTSVIPQIGDDVVFYTILDERIVGVELNGELLYFLQHRNMYS